MSIAVALLALLVAGPAFASQPSDALIDEVPKETKLLVGVDVDKVSKSFLFDELMKLLREQKLGTSVLSFALESGSFDFEKDVDAMLIAFEEPMTNPQAKSTPPSVVVLSGKFEQEKVKQAAAKHFGKLTTAKKGAIEVLSGSGLELGFADANTLIIADAGDYADKTWAAAADAKLSAAKSADVAEMMGLVNTKRGLWIAMLTKGVTAAPGGPAMDGAAISVAVTPGAKLDFLSKFAKEADAAEALKQFEQLKAQSSGNPMVAMFGAQPLMDNLSAKVIQKRVLQMSTSMTEPQLRSMYAKLKAMSQAPPPMTGTPAHPPGKRGADAPATKPPAGGANADFN